MVRKGRLETRNYAYLTTGASTLLFVTPTCTADENLQAKERLWDNALQGNVRPSMAESSQLLDIDISPLQVDWVTVEEAST